MSRVLQRVDGGSRLPLQSALHNHQAWQWVELTRAFSFEIYDFRQVSTMVNMCELYGSQKKAGISLLMTFRGALKPQM